MSDIEIEAKGVNGQIQLCGNKIIIKRQGSLSFLTHGFKGEKEIRLHHITSVQLKTANGLTNGFLQFSISGGSEAKGALFQATQDENTVMFNVKQQPSFQQLKLEVEKRIDTAYESATRPAAPASIADELMKLHQLKEAGVLSEGDFERAKSRLLGS